MPDVDTSQDMGQDTTAQDNASATTSLVGANYQGPGGGYDINQLLTGINRLAQQNQQQQQQFINSDQTYAQEAADKALTGHYSDYMDKLLDQGKLQEVHTYANLTPGSDSTATAGQAVGQQLSTNQIPSVGGQPAPSQSAMDTGYQAGQNFANTQYGQQIIKSLLNLVKGGVSNTGNVLQFTGSPVGNPLQTVGQGIQNTPQATATTSSQYPNLTPEVQQYLNTNKNINPNAIPSTGGGTVNQPLYGGNPAITGNPNIPSAATPANATASNGNIFQQLEKFFGGNSVPIKNANGQNIPLNFWQQLGAAGDALQGKGYVNTMAGIQKLNAGEPIQPKEEMALRTASLTAQRETYNNTLQRLDEQEKEALEHQKTLQEGRSGMSKTIFGQKADDLNKEVAGIHAQKAAIYDKLSQLGYSQTAEKASNVLGNYKSGDTRTINGKSYTRNNKGQWIGGK